MIFNWTSHDFTYTWDSKPFTFKAGQTYSKVATSDVGTDLLLTPGIESHFAKHLADRELSRLGKDPLAEESLRISMIADCLNGPKEEIVPAPEPVSVPEPVPASPSVVSKPAKGKKAAVVAEEKAPEPEFEGV